MPSVTQITKHFLHLSQNHLTFVTLSEGYDMGIIQTNTHIPDYYPFDQERNLLLGRDGVLRTTLDTGHRLLDSINQKWFGLMSRYEGWQARKSLYSLSDQDLLDIGICRKDIEHLFLNQRDAD